MSAFDDDEYVSFDLNDDKTADEGFDDAEDEDLDDDLDDDDLDDAEDEDIDFVLASYLEEGQRTVTALSKDLANDLEELIRQLRRLPADTGAVGFVSLDTDMFVIARIRGEHVQVLLSDGSMAGEWPIARDVADLLGLDGIPDEDDIDPIGDLNIFDDLGLSEIDMAQYCDDDADTDQIVIDIAERLNLTGFRRVAEAELGD
ncbi:MAG: tRNA adenosine deaminase-associated protein [Propionibacteriales bacterium]|nr:tRNA adenosine deaminase-associated protein [Propionibacteriales bacterium]